MKKLCITVPFRDRDSHLEEFIPVITKTLTEQSIIFKILIVEQEAGKPFNRGKLLNIGFDYTKGEYDYYCFHDVDMLPIISDYSYCDKPTHLAVEVEQFDWKLIYETYFGGVTLFDKESFKLINGYANEYWGWGCEDDDVFARCKTKNIETQRKSCRYSSLHHLRPVKSEDYTQNLQKLHAFNLSIENGTFIDGLTTLKYEVKSKEQNESYEKIIVKI